MKRFKMEKYTEACLADFDGFCMCRREARSEKDVFFSVYFFWYIYEVVIIGGKSVKLNEYNCERIARARIV